VGYVNEENNFLAGHPQVDGDVPEDQWLGFESETMLLMGISERIIPIAWTNRLFYDFSYYFSFRPNTHNQARRINDKVNPPTYEYNGFSLDGKLPSNNDTRVFKSTPLAVLFLPNG
jgi:hypothetical protein